MVKAGEVIIRLESKNLETEILNNKDRFAEEENSVQNSLAGLGTGRAEPATGAVDAGA